jgi:GWxTD domain-containing protein
LVVSTIAVGFLVPVQAQQAVAPSAQTAFNKWLNEDVFWIITDPERAAFQKLQTDDERQSFIESFWLRRDPTPDTPVNEFRLEHYRRLQWANDQFRGTYEGWKTDRGMVYVRFGAPDEKDTHPATANSAASETWKYRMIEGLGQDVVFQFVETAAAKDYQLNLSPAEKDRLLHPVTRQPQFVQLNLFDRLREYAELRKR